MEIRQANLIAAFQVRGEDLQKILFDGIGVAKIALHLIPAILKRLETVFVIWGSARVVLRLRTTNRLLRFLGLDPPRWLMIRLVRGSPNP